MTDPQPPAPQSVYEAFGHHEYCAKWKEHDTGMRLDHDAPCTCPQPPAPRVEQSDLYAHYVNGDPLPERPAETPVSELPQGEHQ